MSKVHVIPISYDVDNVQTIVDRYQADNTRAVLILSGEYTWNGTLTITGTPGISVIGTKAVINQSQTSSPTITISSTSDVQVSGIEFVGNTVAPISQDDSPRCNVLLCTHNNTTTDPLAVLNVGSSLFVAPSGGDDSTNIQNAIDQLLYDYMNYKETGTLWMAGRYQIATPIVSGDLDDAYKQAVAICGIGHTTWTYTGDETNDYILRMHGAAKRNWGHARYLLDNIKFDCNWKCRGLLFLRQYHYQHVSNVYIRGHRQAAFDRVNCWMSPVTNLHIENGIGFAIRDNMTEGADYRMIRVGYCHTAIHADDYAGRNNPDHLWTASRNMIDYEGENGYDAAQTEYGDDYIEDWPAVDDDTITYRTDTTARPGTLSDPKLQIPENERALLWFGGRGFLMQSLTLEGNNTGTKPQIAINNQASRHIAIKHLWIEGNRTYREYIHWHAMNTDASQETQGLQLEMVTLQQWYEGRRNCDYFVRVDNETRNGTNTSSSRLMIHDVWIRGVSGLIYCAPGKHYGYDLKGIRTAYADGTNRTSALLPHEWITLADGATYYQDSPYGTNHKLSLHQQLEVIFPVFADATARDAAWSSPTQGAVCFLLDLGSPTIYDGSAWTYFYAP